MFLGGGVVILDLLESSKFKLTSPVRDFDNVDHLIPLEKQTVLS